MVGEKRIAGYLQNKESDSSLIYEKQTRLCHSHKIRKVFWCNAITQNKDLLSKQKIIDANNSYFISYKSEIDEESSVEK